MTHIVQRDATLPVILLTAHGSERVAVAAMKQGAYDYLKKPFDIDEVAVVIERALEARRLRIDNRRMSAEQTLGRRIIGASRPMRRLLEATTRVASRDVTVLVRGETGTGKEFVAELLHAQSSRNKNPLIRFNCAALPADLADAELFGHVRGAFTGATAGRPGFFAQADGGTLILDEIGELPLTVQAKLLRVLQEGEIQPVGADRAVAVDVRVVAATHRDLADGGDGAVRQDFFYRLSAYEIRLPPLAERASDIPALVACFVERTRQRLGLVRAEGASVETLALLARQPWPGNVRQLEHLVQRALIDLGSLADATAVARYLAPTMATTPTAPAIGDDLTLEELERLHIAAVLARVGGHRTRAAAILGIERKSLYRKAERLGLPLDKGDAPGE
jgi:two-component system response regulator AtoC